MCILCKVLRTTRFLTITTLFSGNCTSSDFYIHHTAHITLHTYIYLSLLSRRGVGLKRHHKIWKNAIASYALPHNCLCVVIRLRK